MPDVDAGVTALDLVGTAFRLRWRRQSDWRRWWPDIDAVIAALDLVRTTPRLLLRWWWLLLRPTHAPVSQQHLIGAAGRSIERLRHAIASGIALLAAAAIGLLLDSRSALSGVDLSGGTALAIDDSVRRLAGDRRLVGETPATSRVDMGIEGAARIERNRNRGWPARGLEHRPQFCFPLLFGLFAVSIE